MIPYAIFALILFGRQHFVLRRTASRASKFASTLLAIVIAFICLLATHFVGFYVNDTYRHLRIPVWLFQLPDPWLVLLAGLSIVAIARVIAIPRTPHNAITPENRSETP